NRGWIQFRWKGDLSGLEEFSKRIRPEQATEEDYFPSMLAYHVFAKDLLGAQRLVESVPDDFVVRDSSTYWPKAMLLGIVLEARGDMTGSARNLELAESQLQTHVSSHPDDARAHSSLGRVYAMRGRMDVALEEARTGASMVTMEREPVDGPQRAVDLA